MKDEQSNPIFPIGITENNNKPVFLKSEIIDFLKKNNYPMENYESQWKNNNDIIIVNDDGYKKSEGLDYDKLSKEFDEFINKPGLQEGFEGTIAIEQLEKGLDLNKFKK